MRSIADGRNHNEGMKQTRSTQFLPREPPSTSPRRSTPLTTFQGAILTSRDWKKILADRDLQTYDNPDTAVGCRFDPPARTTPSRARTPVQAWPPAIHAVPTASIPIRTPSSMNGKPTDSTPGPGSHRHPKLSGSVDGPSITATSPAVGLGRSCGARRVDATAIRLVTGAPVGDAGHRPAMAPGREEVDLPEPDGPPAGRRRCGGVDRADGAGEHRLGLPQDPRRVAQARPPGGRLNGPSRARAPTRTACIRT